MARTAAKEDRGNDSHRDQEKHTLWRDTTVPVLEEVRRLLKRAEMTQRALEKRVGFSKGYLSQLLARNLDLKLWHVLAILDGLDEDPGRFFGRVYPERGALERFRESSMPLSRDLDQLLAELYDQGVPPLRDLRERMIRVEQAIDKLIARGLLDETASGQ